MLNKRQSQKIRKLYLFYIECRQRDVLTLMCQTTKALAPTVPTTPPSIVTFLSPAMPGKYTLLSNPTPPAGDTYKTFCSKPQVSNLFLNCQVETVPHWFASPLPANMRWVTPAMKHHVWLVASSSRSVSFIRTLLFNCKCQTKRWQLSEKSWRWISWRPTTVAQWNGGRH